MTWSYWTGTSSSESCSVAYGWMIKAKGSLLFFSRDEVVGMAFKVDRTYFGGQLACGEGVTDDYRNVSILPSNNRKERGGLTLGGRMMAGGA